MAFNFAGVMGNMVADPELRHTEDGTPVLTFRVAVPKPFSKKSAEDGKPTANFITCVAWRQTAETIAKYFKKGQRILVIGSIQTRDYVDKENRKHYEFEIIVDRFEFVERRSDDSPIAEDNASPEASKAYSISPAAVETSAYATATASTDGFPF